MYSQTISWRDCPAPADDVDSIDGAECGTVSVPLDWNSPGRTDRIDVAVNRFRATGGDVKGSVLVNPGGPGSSGKEFAAGLAAEPTTATLRTSYDLIGFDPRGVGETSPIKCANTSNISIVNFSQCIEDNEVSHFMGTTSVAKDMDVIRTLVGDRSLNYFGLSYGTMLGATYATLFPTFVGRMVLDSAESAGWANVIHNYDMASATADAADRYVRSCTVELTAGVRCAFDSPQSLQDRIRQLDERPLASTSGAKFDGKDLRAFVDAALYDRPELRAAGLAHVSAALGGDQRAIDSLITDDDGASVGDARSIVQCFSTPRVPDFVALQQHIRDQGAATQAEVDEALERTGVGELGDCSVLAETGSDITERFDAAGSAPILVTGLTGDHATPYKYARELVDQLGNARLLTLDGDGHGAAYSQSSCITANVDSYFSAGTMPAEGTTCTWDASYQDVPAVDIAASPSNVPQLSGRAPASERIEIAAPDRSTEPQFVAVSDAGTWGPVEVSAGCYDVRTVKPGSRSEPVAVCVDVRNP
ncbi:alpha/beta hydrolase [Rhodococcoides fascians A21d2]|uniref:alpha/beta hydrolase n=1 Tax=Rhodococcoides fascians TaxID=1828 RepID=UPI00068FB585|nr:alpha/beta hydrolase [Rhodococcus fascians]QII00265.1 alpha/beta hydrolase [Rhodococcus fascians A21d2]